MCWAALVVAMTPSEGMASTNMYVCSRRGRRGGDAESYLWPVFTVVYDSGAHMARSTKVAFVTFPSLPRVTLWRFLVAAESPSLTLHKARHEVNDVRRGVFEPCCPTNGYM